MLEIDCHGVGAGMFLEGRKEKESWKERRKKVKKLEQGQERKRRRGEKGQWISDKAMYKISGRPFQTARNLLTK